jgi:hypothetical protein
MGIEETVFHHKQGRNRTYLAGHDGILASAVYLLCIVIYFYPFFPDFVTSLFGPPEDNLQDLWNTWYSQKVIASDLAGFHFTRSINYPEGSSLVYHSFSYTNLFLIFLIRTLLDLSIDINVLIGLNNFMIFLSFFLAALGTFYLAKYFTDNFLTALIAGFIFSFSPFHVAHSLHHMHIATVQYIPFFVLCFLKYMKENRSLQFMGVVLFFALSALSSFYYLVYNILFITFYYLYSVSVSKKIFIKDVLVRSGWILCCGFLILAPFWLPMFLEGMRNENAYAPGHNTFVADVFGLIVFHPYHLLATYVTPIHNRFSGNPWEMSVYLGMANVALLIWSIITGKAFKLRGYTFCLGGIAFFMLFAVGSSLHILGKTFDFPLLPTALAQYIPFLRNVRTPSRAIVYVYLFLALATGLTIKNLFYEREWNGSYRLRSVILAALSAFIFFDFYPANLDSTKVSCPPAYGKIRDDPSLTSGVLDLPMTYIAGNYYMAYQICHEKPIVHATISRKLKQSLSDYLELTDLDAQRQQLKESHVKYVVIHKDLLTSKDRIDLEAYQKNYSTVYADEQKTVFEVY